MAHRLLHNYRKLLAHLVCVQRHNVYMVFSGLVAVLVVFVGGVVCVVVDVAVHNHHLVRSSLRFALSEILTLQNCHQDRVLLMHFVLLIRVRVGVTTTTINTTGQSVDARPHSCLVIDGHACRLQLPFDGIGNPPVLTPTRRIPHDHQPMDLGRVGCPVRGGW